MNPDIRWKQRMQSFERALRLLGAAVERAPDGLSDLEKEGAVQRFEYTFELAWKTLKDYLEDRGILLEQHTPRETIKNAFAARLPVDGDLWIEMLGQRNLMAHVYDQEHFDHVLDAIRARYWAEFDRLARFLREKAQET